MTDFEQPLDARANFSSLAAPPHITEGVKVFIVLAFLLAYAVGFALLYPIAQTSMAKSAAEGNDPTAWQLIGP